jgi:hypothetical protein
MSYTLFYGYQLAPKRRTHMAINHRTNVVGVFRDRAMAEQAMQALANAGFDPGNIRFSSTGAGTGGGFLEGIRSLFVAPTASESDITNDLSQMGLTNEEARYYSSEHANGNIILAVKAEDRDQEAISIMHQYGAYSYDTTHNPQQTAGYTPTSTAYNTPQQSTPYADPNATDPLRDEHASDPLNEAPYNADDTTQVYHPRAQVMHEQASQAEIDQSQTDAEKARQHQTQADMMQAQADSDHVEGHPVRAAADEVRVHHEQKQADREQEHTANQYEQAADEQNAADDSRSTQPVTPYQPQTAMESEPIMQATNSATKYNSFEELQAQFRAMQQQLQEAQSQLAAAKEREQELRTNKEREAQHQEMQKQIQEMQTQLQTTLAELQETQSRIAQYN